MTKTPPSDEVWWNREPWWLLLLALPFVQIKNIINYAAMQETRAEKIGVVIYMLGPFLWVTLFWLSAWVFLPMIAWAILVQAFS
jgi:hypothetical protein